MEDRELVEIVNRGTEDFNSLSVEEKLSFDTFIHRFLQFTEQAMYMVRDRYIPAGSYDAFVFGAIAFTSHGAGAWWSDAKLTFSKWNLLRKHVSNIPMFLRYGSYSLHSNSLKMVMARMHSKQIRKEAECIGRFVNGQRPFCHNTTRISCSYY